MKVSKITYWATTGIISFMMLYSAYAYFGNPQIKDAFVHLGFPDWFRQELGIAKLLGAIALIVPMIPARIKEWAYFGFFVNFFSAFLAHFVSGDPVNNQVTPLVLLAILIVSYITFHQVKSQRGSNP